MPRFVTADSSPAHADYGAVGAARTPRRVQEAHLRAGRALPFTLPADDQVAADVEAHARLDHGRWVVDCPACPSAQLASFEDRRFFCTDCHNAAAGGAWVPVRWPPANQLEAVEAELELRPADATRNWRPGESVDDVRAENAAHGIPPTKRRA